MTKSNNNKNMRQKAAAYCRISTEEQSSYSITHQKEQVIKEAKAQNLELPEENIFIDEGFSARTLERPAFKKLLDLVRIEHKTISAIIVYKIDRISRDTADYLGFRKTLSSLGIKIISTTEPTDDSPAGEFIETILAAAGRYDNLIKIQRVKAGLIGRIKDGLPLSVAPLGYINFNGTIQEDKRYFEYLQNAWYMMLKKTYTLDQIANYLNENGVRLNYGKKEKIITKQYLSKMFLNKTYAGYAISKRNNLEVKSDKFKPMIDDSVYYKVRSILMERNQSPSLYQKLRPEFPLRGYILCPICNQPLRAGYSKGRSKYYGYYFCQDHSTPSIPSDDIDDLYINLLRQTTPDPLTRQLFLDMVKDQWNEKYMTYVKSEERLKTKEEEFKKMKLMIAEKVMNGVFDDETAKAMYDRIEQDKLIEYNIPKHDVEYARVDIENLVSWMNLFLKDLGKAYMLTKDLQLQRFFTGSIFPKNMIYRKENLEPLGLSPSFALMDSMKQGTVPSCAEERT